jgi:hypothetical protein
MDNHINSETILYTRDEDGLEVAQVPLRDRSHAVIGRAVIERDGLEALQAAGVPTPWFLNTSSSGNAYVNAPDRVHKGRSLPVARTVLGTGKGTVVRYRDGNRLNLKRSNLYLAKHAAAKGKTPLGGSDFAETSARP